MAVSYTPQMQLEYQQLFDTCVTRPEKISEVNALVNKMVSGKARYKLVGDKLNIPWYFIAVVHAMECGLNFKSHLHNGDPLTARTVQVPKGRPVKGKPPFKWEDSAEDALTYENIDKWKDWSVPAMLYKLEGFNGYGYRNLPHPMPSPYLWSYSYHYSKGKFVGDHVFNPESVSKQCGAAVLLQQLLQQQHILPEGMVDKISLIRNAAANVRYLPNQFVQRAQDLQKLLNAAGEHLEEDGKAGKLTSDALFKITGLYLSGDPRVANAVPA